MPMCHSDYAFVSPSCGTGGSRGVKNQHKRARSDGVPMYNGREFNNKLQRQWAFIRHIPQWWWLHVNAGPQCVTAECDRVFSPQASHYYWLPPLTCRVDIHLLKVLMEGWGTPILRPEQKDSLSLHVMVAHVWQTWPTFPPILSHNSLSLF